MKKEIKIAGAGISGLTCAINLAKAGYKVTVFEKSKQVGSRHDSDLQGIGNWFFKKDIMQLIQNISVTAFPSWPVRELSFWSPSLREHRLEETRPFFYLVKRGPKGSLDENLAQQAQASGVKIEFSTKAPSDCQVVATGSKRASAYAAGLAFDTGAPDQCHGMLSKQVAPGGYAYLLINNNRGTLASVFLGKVKSSKTLAEKATEQFKKAIEFDIKNPKSFGGYGQFFVPSSAKRASQLYVGEAAGFQDYLFGFGMTYAFFSGYLAAKSIIEEKDYNQLWRNCFLDELKASIYNRFLFEMSKNLACEAMLKVLGSHSQPLKALHKRYHLSFLKRLAYPVCAFTLSTIKKRDLFRNVV